MHECEERLGYEFKNKSLLRQCFTHSSYSHEHGKGKDNERLEFFGDSILGFLTAEYLVKEFPDADEGKLTEYKQALVSRKPLADAIKKCGLSDFILYGEGESRNSPENHEAANENLFEAIVAGIYLDGGLDEAKKFVQKFLFSPLKRTLTKRVAETKEENKFTDVKSLLQTFVQRGRLGEIVYKEKSVSGPPHAPLFVMTVSVGGKTMGEGKGKTKSQASKNAAEKAYLKLTAKNAAAKNNKPAKGNRRNVK
ncbi:MAG: ribonuclease III [Clostridia bacterium]|nr:ribonuclease III [Clostridia bacterium]